MKKFLNAKQEFGRVTQAVESLVQRVLGNQTPFLTAGDSEDPTGELNHLLENFEMTENETLQVIEKYKDHWSLLRFLQDLAVLVVIGKNYCEWALRGICQEVPPQTPQEFLREQNITVQYFLFFKRFYDVLCVFHPQLSRSQAAPPMNSSPAAANFFPPLLEQPDLSPEEKQERILLAKQLAWLIAALEHTPFWSRIRRVEKIEIIQKIHTVCKRYAEGNHDILNPEGDGDLRRSTAYKYIDEAREYFRKL